MASSLMGNKKLNKYVEDVRIIKRVFFLIISVLVLLLQLTFPAATPTGQLLKQIGSGAPLSYGDYISSSAGLNTYYSYYIEVPVSLNRLVVRIFDADVGMGGNHDWTPDSYNTSVTYTVYDPNGNTVAQDFTTGSRTGPSNSDNKWRRLCRVNSPTAGHWELRVDMSSAVTSGNEMNGYGIGASDNTGTELNIYAESFLPVGQLGSPALQTTQLYPYVTSGGTVDSNDFDGDNGAGTYCTLAYTTRLNAVASFNGSGSSSWLNAVLSGFNSDNLATDYGIWNASLSYYNASSNFATYYMGNYNAANPPPSSQPESNTLRIYIPNNAGGAPLKPFLAQRVSYVSGANPPSGGSTTRVKVAVTIFNPTPYSITFSATNLVTAYITGSCTLYAGNASVTQGSITGQPSIGGTGSITWNPGAVSGSGNSETLYYDVDVTPSSTGQRIPVTGTPGSNGTTATYVDETGNTSQSRSTFTFGPLSELAVTEGTDIPTLAAISSFSAYEENGRVVVQWQTDSEIGTSGFNLLRSKNYKNNFSSGALARNPGNAASPRRDEAHDSSYLPAQGDSTDSICFHNRDDSGNKYQKVNQVVLPALLHYPRGGIYRMVDETARYGETYTYKLVEIESNGRTRNYGPFTVTIGAKQIDYSKPVSEPLQNRYDKKPHPVSPEKKVRMQARQREAALARTSGNSGDKNSLKITIKNNGIYYVAAGDIAKVMGLHSTYKVAAMIGNLNLQLSNRGEDVSWLPAKGNRGLYFYGESIDSLYSDENVYLLKLGGGVRMGFAHSGSPVPGSEDETFNENLHIEEDRYALTAIFTDPSADFWLWDFIRAGESGKVFKFQAPNPAAYGTAYLTIHLKGATATDPDHHAKVSLNGNYIGECRWDGLDAHRFDVPLNQALLAAGQNTLEITGILGSDVPHSIFYLDSFDLNYQRHFRAVNDRLLFRSSGSPVVTVSGFTHPDIRVFDVTRPKRPQLVTGAHIDGNNRISFMPAGPKNIYLALSPQGLRTPVSLTVDKPSSLKRKQNSADYVIIAGEGLEVAAQDLANLRQNRGYETMVVAIEDIYDEFNHGIKEPEAIRRFLSYAYRYWRGNIPHYVALAGEGTYDYKNILGYGDNLIPPMMVQTPNGLFASDTGFGDVAANDGVPEIAVGRLPVLTSAELQSYVDKLSDYEAAGGDWTGRALMLADDPDEGGDFPNDSDRLANLLPGYAVNKVYLPGYATIDKAKEKLIECINSGVMLVNFIGHAGLNQLTGEGLFKSADLSSLHNGAKLPLFTAVTCVAGRFAVPGYDSLGEILLLKSGGGAAAVWAPSGASFNNPAKHLAENLYKVLFQQREKVLGKALLQAMRNYAATGDEPFILGIYNLLGDPALEIK
jgi:hypothetical protein